MSSKGLFAVLIVVAILFAAMVTFGVVKDKPNSKLREGAWADAVEYLFHEPEIAAGDLADVPAAASCPRQGQLLLVPAGGACAVRVVPSDQQTRNMKLTSLVGTKVQASFVPAKDKHPQIPRKFELKQTKTAKFSVFAKGGDLSLFCQALPGAPACTVRVGS